MPQNAVAENVLGTIGAWIIRSASVSLANPFDRHGVLDCSAHPAGLEELSGEVYERVFGLSTVRQSYIMYKHEREG
jgi:hypothetical protein